MAAINVSEDDFGTVAWAAQQAKDRGDMKSAQALDKIARKINASLANETARKMPGAGWMGKPRPITWDQCPSTLI